MKSTDPVVIVSADTHIGPLLEDQLRPYCPQQYLPEFDVYVQEDREYRRLFREASPHLYCEIETGRVVRNFHNIRTAGHHDMHARLRDLNFDGVAAEVIFHASLNDEPIPFTDMGDPSQPTILKNHAPTNPELGALGRHIYNQWLADVCTIEPERHVGLAQLPIWDIGESIKEMEWAKSVGLRGVNLPAPQSWLPQFNKPAWEPFWAAAVDLDMPLVSHIGVATDADYSGPEGIALMAYEISTLFGFRALPFMILGGVFERHPRLKMVVTETPGVWFAGLRDNLDSVWRRSQSRYVTKDRTEGTIISRCPHPPSYYLKTNIFGGVSFMNRDEASAASSDGTYTNLMWGSDYPHPEGTFFVPSSEDEKPLTHTALQFACHDLPEDHVRAMLGGTAVEAYGLDRAKLEKVAARIGAPSYEDLNHEPELPTDPDILTFAFRTGGTWG